MSARLVIKRRYLVIGVLVMLIFGTFAWFRLAPYEMSRDEAEATVERLGGAGVEYFYFGEEADGLHLASINVDEEDGRMIFEYGRCMDFQEGGCNRPLNVYSTPVQLGANDHLPPGDCLSVRQVLGEGNEVLIHLSKVEITYWDRSSEGYETNFPRSKALVPQLRPVGQASPPNCAAPPQ